MKKTKSMSTQTMVTGAVLTALVAVLQFISGYLTIVGLFTLSLVLIPIVIGTATCGKKIGAWLGFVFALVVLADKGTLVFYGMNIPGTVITVLVKGVLCGYISGLVYEKSINKFPKKQYLSTLLAAIACPLTNTTVFLLGSLIFFRDFIIGAIMIVMVNFVLELFANIIFAPVIVRIINAVKK